MPFGLHTAFQEVSSSLKNLQQMLVLIEGVLRSADFRPILKRNENPNPLVSSSSWKLLEREAPTPSVGLPLQGYSSLNLSLSSRANGDLASKELEQNPLDSVDLSSNANLKRTVCFCNCGKFMEDDDPSKTLHISNHHFVLFSFDDLSAFFPANGSPTMKNLIKSIHLTDEKHATLICKCKDSPVMDTSISENATPTSLSQNRLHRTPGRKRKRIYNCSRIGEEQPKHWTSFAVDRLRLGFGFQEFLGSSIKGMTSKVLGFARLQGEPSLFEATAVEESLSSSSQCNYPERSRSLKAAINRLNVKLPNIDILKPSQLATILVEFMERVPHIGKVSQEYPDKQKLSLVQDFFKYTEAEGKKLFDELDRDRDGQVTLEDLHIAMRKWRLPHYYAQDFLHKTRKHWFKRSIGWPEFLSLMEQKEPLMLRAFNSLCVSKSGTLQMGQILSLLLNAGLPATEGNAAAMMRFFDADTEGVITYGQFRNFLLLLPSERLVESPRMVWFEAATVVPMAPPVEIPAGDVLKSALAGGLACALSTALMYPLDTVKTRVQASTISFSEVISKLPQVGVRGLYRGSVPAILGQFSSHGLRTGIFEVSRLLLINTLPTVSDLQVQSIASFCSTVLGTAIRIPCEVLKQRLQAGLYANVREAFIGTIQQDGVKGFFRGTGVTLCREVPFYVAGMGIYEEAKKIIQKLLERELAPWETIAIGGISGGLAAVCTTPFDVLKTRTMTAASGMPVSMSRIAIHIIQEEGVLALFKGALPRFFWIAPLGAMNFAGYELAKRAMSKEE